MTMHDEQIELVSKLSDVDTRLTSDCTGYGELMFRHTILLELLLLEMSTILRGILIYSLRAIRLGPCLSKMQFVCWSVMLVLLYPADTWAALQKQPCS